MQTKTSPVITGLVLCYTKIKSEKKTPRCVAHRGSQFRG